MWKNKKPKYIFENFKVRRLIGKGNSFVYEATDDDKNVCVKEIRFENKMSEFIFRKEVELLTKLKINPTLTSSSTRAATSSRNRRTITRPSRSILTIGSQKKEWKSNASKIWSMPAVSRSTFPKTSSQIKVPEEVRQRIAKSQPTFNWSWIIEKGYLYLVRLIF